MIELTNLIESKINSGNILWLTIIFLLLLITNLPKIKQIIEDYIPTKKKELKKHLECLEDKHSTSELIDFVKKQYTITQFNYLYNIIVFNFS